MKAPNAYQEDRAKKSPLSGADQGLKPDTTTHRNVMIRRLNMARSPMKIPVTSARTLHKTPFLHFLSVRPAGSSNCRPSLAPLSALGNPYPYPPPREGENKPIRAQKRGALRRPIGDLGPLAPPLGQKPILEDSAVQAEPGVTRRKTTAA